MTRADDDGEPATPAAEPDRAQTPKRTSRPETAGREAGHPPGDIHTYIGSRLRQAFDDIASQPVPDRFLQLMQDLDKA